MVSEKIVTAPSPFRQTLRVERVTIALVKFEAEHPPPARVTWEMVARIAIATSDAALEKAGYAIVPRHATERMQEAAAKLLACPDCDGFGADIHQTDIWRAMWDAAPMPEAE